MFTYDNIQVNIHASPTTEGGPMDASVMINFRVKPEERTQLRVALLQRGQTIQEYFAGIVARILENRDKPNETSEPDDDDQRFQRQRAVRGLTHAAQDAK
jgi:hypothetical protein